jgi:hypothetical protein
MTNRLTPPSRLRTSLAAAALAFGLSAFTVSGTARADDVSGAANAFSRAQKAELSGDFASAAELYELADGLAPAPEALRSALRARKSAGELDLAAVHAEELLDRYPNDAKSTELANATLDEASKKLMRYEVACLPTACTVLVDGGAAGPDAKQKHVLYLTPGNHDVVASFGKNRTPSQSLEGKAGDRGALSFEAPPEPPSTHLDSGDVASSGGGAPGVDQGVHAHNGISPWFFVGGAVATVGLGAATIWSGLDVLSANDTYKKNPTQAGYNDGKDRELRTNVLIGATAVVGAATGVLAILTDWSGKRGEEAAQRPGVRASAAVTGNSAAIVVSGVY